MPERKMRTSAAHRGSRCNGFRTLQGLEDGLYLAYDLQKRFEANKERAVSSRQGPRQMFTNRPPITRQCSVVPKSNVPNALQNGKFSFWRDLRGPFKITGLAILDDQSPDFQALCEESDSLRNVPLAELNEVYKIEWEAYLSYDVERNFTDIEDRRIWGIAVVKVPLNYKKGALKVYSWGKPSCFDKKLEFLFKPESKKPFGPTKGKLPPDQSSLNRSQRLNSPTSRASASDLASTVASWGISPSDSTSFDGYSTGSTHWPTVPFGRRSPAVASDTTRKSPFGSPLDSTGSQTGLLPRSCSSSPRTRRTHSADSTSVDVVDRRRKLNRTGVDLMTGWRKYDPAKSNSNSFYGSRELSHRIISDNLFASTGHELGFFQSTRVYDTQKKIWKPAKKQQKCRYLDPDFHDSCMHASKIMSVDRLPFLSVIL
ncbi:unnamed protein product [Amoebophrya sp. A120]|nr:unnamed protein product [Amoebophrya sp. A120]|eukprot:GSA120T00017281001.1